VAGKRRQIKKEEKRKILKGSRRRFEHKEEKTKRTISRKKENKKGSDFDLIGARGIGRKKVGKTTPTRPHWEPRGNA